MLLYDLVHDICVRDRLRMHGPLVDRRRACLFIEALDRLQRASDRAELFEHRLSQIVDALESTPREVRLCRDDGIEPHVEHLCLLALRQRVERRLYDRHRALQVPVFLEAVLALCFLDDSP